jgi:hypothetical protein
MRPILSYCTKSIKTPMWLFITFLISLRILWITFKEAHEIIKSFMVDSKIEYEIAEYLLIQTLYQSEIYLLGISIIYSEIIETDRKSGILPLLVTRTERWKYIIGTWLSIPAAVITINIFALAGIYSTLIQLDLPLSTAYLFASIRLIIPIVILHSILFCWNSYFRLKTSFTLIILLSISSSILTVVESLRETFVTKVLNFIEFTLVYLLPSLTFLASPNDLNWLSTQQFFFIYLDNLSYLALVLFIFCGIFKSVDLGTKS